MSFIQGQSKALVLACSAVEGCMSELIDLAWHEYAAPRWNVGTPTERNHRLQLAAEVYGAHERMRKQAWRGKREVKYSRARLEFFVLKSLDHACPFCSGLYGVESMGIAWNLDPGDACWHSGGNPFELVNVVVCCDVCAKGKGELTGDEFLELSLAIGMLDDDKGNRVRRALAAGRSGAAGAAKTKGTSAGAGACG